MRLGRGEDRMSFELAMLAASCVLCLVQIVISSHAASLQRGYRWTASSRDVEAPPLTGVAGRLERALRRSRCSWLRSCLCTFSIAQAKPPWSDQQSCLRVTQKASSPREGKTLTYIFQPGGKRHPCGI